MEFEGMISNDPEMLRVFDTVTSFAEVDSPVLVRGETGTGKELIARAIHTRSRRNDNSFVPINCGAIPEGLLESELFGHEKGAFTGADAARKGIFEEADGGVLFLDEIGDTTLALQVKLLRAIQEGEFRVIGGNRTVRVNVRIISATNVDLQQSVRDKKFREDLYYRLHVLEINLPPLRDRGDDFELLAYHFMEAAAAKIGRRVDGIEDEAREKLGRYSWPGNVRQLESMTETAVLSCCLDKSLPPDARRMLRLKDFPRIHEKVAVDHRKTRITDKPFYDACAEFEKEYIDSLLKRHNYNIAASARAGKISRKSLRTKAIRYGLIGGEEREAAEA